MCLAVLFILWIGLAGIGKVGDSLSACVSVLIPPVTLLSDAMEVLSVAYGRIGPRRDVIIVSVRNIWRFHHGGR